MKDVILVTGAPGNVGTPLVRRLVEAGYRVRAAVWEPEKAKETLGDGVELVRFDFLDPTTFKAAFRDVRAMFLMRPPAISDVKRGMFPAMDAAKAAGVEHMVFLSLMGGERNPVVPHYRVERKLEVMGVGYTFLRPTYFMQNLNTTHCRDIREKGEITIGAGKGKMSFIDARDIAEVAFRVLTEPGHVGKAYTLTGSEAYDYFRVAEIFTGVLGRPIHYVNPSIPAYRRNMAKQGYPKALINVTTMMYILARLGVSAGLTDDTRRLLGREPLTMREYVRDHAAYWMK